MAENYTGIDIVHEYTISGTEYIDNGYVVLKDSTGSIRVPLNDLHGFKGIIEIEQLESLSSMTSGDIYAISDSGTFVNIDGTALVITHGDMVQYNGMVWSLLIRLTDYVSFERFNDAIIALTSAIDSAFSVEHAYAREHIENRVNPHNVTAEQIKAVRYDTDSQGLTDVQKENARTNIGAISEASVDANVLRIADPTNPHVGTNEMLFYRGTLV